MDSDFLRLARRVKEAKAEAQTSLKADDAKGTFLTNGGGTISGSLDVSGVLRSNGNAVWHAGNDGAGSGLDADTLRGYGVSGAGFGSIPRVHTDGVMEIGKIIDWHYASNDGLDYKGRTEISPDGRLHHNGNEVHHQGNVYYESGFWTPRVIGTSTAGSATYNWRSGRYQRIGNWVKVSGYFSVANKSTMAGYVAVTDLPFASADYSSGGIGSEEGVVSGVHGRTIGIQINPGVNYFTLMRTSATVTTYLNATEINTSGFTVMGFYLEYPIA